MSKMNNEFLKHMERQFGDVLVSNSEPCRFCGESYGDHLGFTCPSQLCPLCGKPSPHCEVHKECADREAMRADS
ncbi:hypothetical protein LCGC14_1598560 [marine sediment metagenome]|uniref:Uncharacterized protein n=1 Tax=marine sediment metagenome TaxID=412755 RepID=A0A0F9IYA5_9ZZZZ